MRKCLRPPLAFIGFLAIPAFAVAHHSIAEFDAEKKITLDAIVKEVWFSNPHVHYFVVAKNSDGIEETWDVHGASVTALARRNWTKNTIKVGDKIKVVGSPQREGIKRVLISTVALSDGTVLGSSQRYDTKEKEAQ